MVGRCVSKLSAAVTKTKENQHIEEKILAPGFRNSVHDHLALLFLGLW
jgi:hypothetical protein